MATNSAPGPISRLPDPATVRGWLLDVAGLAFVAAAIYVGVFRGAQVPEFSVFVGLAAAYLGLKA
jgi:hypothetical protein